MKDFSLILIGAICSALGVCVAGCLTIWYQAKKTRQIRMEEKTAEVIFEARRKALELIRKSRTSLMKREHNAVRKLYCDNGFWFSENWMFLPEGFVEGWKSIGLKLQELSLQKQGEKGTQDDNKKQNYIQKEVDLSASLPKLAVKAENVLRKKMGLKEAE